MNTLLLVFGVGLVGLSARLVARAVVVPRLHLKQHLREIADYGFEGPITETDVPLMVHLKRTFRRISTRVGGFVMRRFSSLKPLSTGELAAAGFYDASVELVHGYRVIGAFALPLFLTAICVLGGTFSMLLLVAILLSAAAGWVLPSFTIRKRGAARLDDIERQLPELIDLLIATVEAGMGFTASLGMIAERMEAPLGDELRLTMKQQALGMTTSQSLEEMALRCQTPSMRAFVRTAARGESLGISIGPVLREMSMDQRKRRRQAAHEKMQKAPVKMIFPLMFLIMPALMIVLMYPVAYSLTHNIPGF
jgi:tight adherence protein C